jgi:mannose-1-phosphate guanylyltransferase
MTSNLYALILAGGSGERFWPLSRRSKPKQLLSLFSKETLLEATLARLEGLVPRERILILTNCDQIAAVRALATGLPPENIVAEPAKRDTAAAIALGAAWIARRDANAIMMVLPADQLISNIIGFQKTLMTAAKAAQDSTCPVTIGIQPTWACPSFGYIEQGCPVAIEGIEGDSPGVFEVRRFREKPNAELAESFLAEGNFRWNAGMFVWTIPAVLGELKKHVPKLAGFVEAVCSSPNQDAVDALIAERFAELPKVSIDYAVMEKAKRVLEVEAAFDWDDVGSWIAAAKYWEKDKTGNTVNGQLTTLNASNNIVFADPKVRIALVGVEGLIVVQTADALLICRREEADKIKHLVAKLPVELQ